MTWKLLVDRPTDKRDSQKAIARAVARGAMVAKVNGARCVLHEGAWLPVSHSRHGMVLVDGREMDAHGFIEAYARVS